MSILILTIDDILPKKTEMDFPVSYFIKKHDV